MEPLHYKRSSVAARGPAAAAAPARSRGGDTSRPLLPRLGRGIGLLHGPAAFRPVCARGEQGQCGHVRGDSPREGSPSLRELRAEKPFERWVSVSVLQCLRTDSRFPRCCCCGRARLPAVLSLAISRERPDPKLHFVLTPPRTALSNLGMRYGGGSLLRSKRMRGLLGDAACAVAAGVQSPPNIQTDSRERQSRKEREGDRGRGREALGGGAKTHAPPRATARKARAKEWNHGLPLGGHRASRRARPDERPRECRQRGALGRGSSCAASAGDYATPGGLAR